MIRFVPKVEALEARAVPTVLPLGFSETILTSNLNSPTAMELAPDGRLFVAQQTGALRIIKNDAPLATPFVSLNVDSSGERGLLGVAFDPNFGANHFVYVYYTSPNAAVHNRVSRFTANGDVAVPGSEQVLLDLDNLSGATNHNGGAIHFGPDGKLYVAVGDNANGSNAQTLANRLGKMLRINSDGTIPTDNPFFNTATGANRSIWALGLRNPFTFAFQPGTGRMFIDDVGQSTWEEIDDGIAGSNYGWPTTEGPTSNPAFRAPLFAYLHGNDDTTGCAITGGAFYNPATAQFPSSFVGTYFFSDLCGDWIRRFDPASGTATGFATDLGGGLVGLKVDAAGQLYYLTGAGSSTGTVARILFSAPPPSPSLIVAPDAGLPPRVHVIDAATNIEQFSILAFNANFLGGVRIATGDVTGDHVDDIIVAAGPGGGPHVRVFDGATALPVAGPIGGFFAFDPGFHGGLFVAAGDIDGDGFADVIVGADAGGGPHVKVFSGHDGSLLRSFFAYDAGFPGGVRVAAVDLDGDLRADSVTAAGPGGGPHVKVFSGQTGATLASFFAYDPGFHFGVYVAAGKSTGGAAQILTGAGAGGGPHVKLFSGPSALESAGFFAYDPHFLGGVRVGVGDVDNDGRLEFITGPGPGGGPHVRVFDDGTLADIDSLFAFDPTFTGGVFVSGTH